MSNDLLDTFKATYTLIDNVTQGSNYQDLLLLLDDYVIMKRVDDALATSQGKPVVIAGKDSVSQYFRDVVNRKNDNAQFSPVTTFSATFGSTGVVWGLGTYQDKLSDQVPSLPNLGYSFVYRNTGGNWFALLLWGIVI
jgi:hypothetical protein